MLITVVRDGAFLTVQLGVAVSGPLLSGPMLAVAFSARVLAGLTARELGAGAAMGAALFAASVSQACGLQTVPSSESAFITAPRIPVVPLLQWGLLRRLPALTRRANIGFAFAGTLLFTGRQVGQVGVGLGGSPDTGQRAGRLRAGRLRADRRRHRRRRIETETQIWSDLARARAASRGR